MLSKLIIGYSEPHYFLLVLHFVWGRQYYIPSTAEQCTAATYTYEKSIDPGLIIRAQSFPRAEEFRAEPRILGFSAVFEPRNLPRYSSFCRVIPRNLTFFIRTTIFSRQMTSTYPC